MTDEHATTIMRAPADTPARMHPMVQAAMASIAHGSFDPATLRELLAVQRDWEAGEARKAFTRALAALKRDLPTVIVKDATVDFANNSGKKTHYTHATLAGVMDAITGPLTQHGFSLAWEPSSTERGGVRVTCRLTHSEGHSQECSLDAPPDTSGSKSSAQATASTITLLSRYTALALLGIATKDMKEDTGQREQAQASGAVDAKRNLSAAGWLADRKIPLADVEKHIGRTVKEWTAADLEAVRAYGKERAPKADGAKKAEERAAAIARGEDPNA